VVGPVGSIRLPAVGDAGRASVGGGAHEGDTALGEAEPHLFETVIDNREGGLRVGAEPAALGPVVGSVDKCFTVL